jgi:hypothetical protein
MLNKLFRAFAMKHFGVDCRACGGSVHGSDHLGLSEGVCRTCR